MKTVASLIALVAIGTWAFFGIQEKLNKHSTKLEIMEKDLQSEINQTHEMCKDLNISDGAKSLICEMIFQLGGRGVSKFRKMWAALREDPPNYFEAHVQMLDSRWAKQTPTSCCRVASGCRTTYPGMRRSSRHRSPWPSSPGTSGAGRSPISPTEARPWPRRSRGTNGSNALPSAWPSSSVK